MMNIYVQRESISTPIQCNIFDWIIELANVTGKFGTGRRRYAESGRDGSVPYSTISSQESSWIEWTYIRHARLFRSWITFTVCVHYPMAFGPFSASGTIYIVHVKNLCSISPDKNMVLLLIGGPLACVYLNLWLGFHASMMRRHRKYLIIF